MCLYCHPRLDSSNLIYQTLDSSVVYAAFHAATEVALDYQNIVFYSHLLGGNRGW